MLTTIVNKLIQAREFKGKQRLLRAILRQVDGKVVRSKYGVLMRSRAHDFTNYACISGTFHSDYDDVFAEVDALRPGMAFVDIGANAGLFSMVAGRRVGPTGVVLSFEPNRRIFADMAGNIVSNQLENVFPFNAAVGRETGKFRFTNGSRDHSGIGKLSQEGDVEVAAMSFSDQVLFDLLIEGRHSMIKIDVEGAEGLVLEALGTFIDRPSVETVVIEIDDSNLRTFGYSASYVYERMAGAGFKHKRGIDAALHFNEIFYR